jgi:16S rRNA (guanine527-N7)-methyltransferase
LSRPANVSYQGFETLISKDAFGRLEKYVQLLEKWRRITNLISDQSFIDVWDRHIVDAIHLQHQRSADNIWLDIGSGAGLPGVVLASILADRPDARVHCVEIDRRKCSFLREVASKIALPLKVHNTLAEHMSALIADEVEVVTARAFSSLDRILRLAEPFMRSGAVAILPRGRSAQEEVARLDRALYSWKTVPNPSPGDGVFVQIELRDSRAS